MKKAILVVISVALMFFSFTANAADPEFSITVPDDFTVAYYGEDLSHIAQALQIDNAKIGNYFAENGLLYLAVSSDTETQVRLSIYNDNFSSRVNDISMLDDTALGEFVTTLNSDCTDLSCVITNSDRKFVKVKNTLNDSGGQYTVTQYITIANSKTYYLSCYNSGSDTDSTVEEIFDSFSISVQKQPHVTKSEEVKNYTPLYIAGIAVFSIIAVVIAASILISCKKQNK